MIWVKLGFFEEVLESRNIGFYVSKETYTIPYNRQDTDGMSVEYVLVTNKEDVAPKSLLNSHWDKVTLSWLTNQKCINKESRWSREYQTFLSTKNIGLSHTHSGDIKKKDVKYFKTMREDTFSGIIDNVFAQNNFKYYTLIENFRLAKERIITNKIEDDKLKDFIRTNLIPIIEPEFISNISLNLEEKNFNVTVTKNNGGYHSNRFEVLEITRNVDNFEMLEYRVEFFGNRRRSVNNADEAIKLINNVFTNNMLRNVMDSFIKALEI